jgi:hypothetical protein
MMCMQCYSGYLQQMSTARDTLDFCSGLCELEYKSPSKYEIVHTECTVGIHNASLYEPADLRLVNE